MTSGHKLAALGAFAVLILTGCTAVNPKHLGTQNDHAALTAPVESAPPVEPPPPTALTALGPTRTSALPADTTQVVVVDAPTSKATTNTVSMWEKTDSGWHEQGAPVTARNGYNGWKEHRHDGDGTSPIGMFSLTAAAGRLPNPGSTLPYEFDATHYTTHGTFMGGNLAGAYDYVVAIDYNRVPGSPPSDRRRPDGRIYGGDVWFHVDHHSPTHACISLPIDQMRDLLLWLDPAEHPIVVMGPDAYVGA